MEISVDFSAGPIQQFLSRARKRLYLYYTCSVLTILEPIDILFSTCLITSVSIAESPRIDEVNFKEPKETRSEEDSENSRIDSARLRLLSLFDERSTRLFNDGIDCEKEARILTR